MRIEALAASGILLAAAVPVACLAAPGDNVAVRACARAGVEANCMVITGEDGSVYNITAANPKPPFDVKIQLRGTVTDKLSACNQGLVLENINWTPTQEKCGN